MLTRKTLLNSISRYKLSDFVMLTIYHNDLSVSVKVSIFDAIKLSQMFPNSTTQYEYYKLSD